MIGVLMSVIAGAAMSMQGVLNTRLGEKMGIYEANVFVQGTAFILAIMCMIFLGKGSFKAVFEVNKIYWLAGVFGLIITITVMQAIGRLSPTQAISVVLISQLVVAALIDAFGILGTEKLNFGMTKYIGVAIMVLGVIIFKWKI